MVCLVLTLKQERVNKNKMSHGGQRLLPGRVVGLMLDVGPQCVNTGSGNVLLTSGQAG